MSRQHYQPFVHIEKHSGYSKTGDEGITLGRGLRREAKVHGSRGASLQRKLCSYLKQALLNLRCVHIH